MRKLCTMLVLALCVSMLAGLSFATADGSDPIRITYLSCWNGGGTGIPVDQENSPYTKYLIDKFNAWIYMESIVTNETEKLNTMFASGVLPDVVNAPYWSTTSGEGKVIKDAASQGFLLDLTPYLADHPNLSYIIYNGVAQDFAEYEQFHPEYEGAVYIIPNVNDPDVTTNWFYGSYIRGDLIDTLGIDPAEINTAEKLYELAVMIKESGVTDTAGGEIIPMGTWHNGWSYDSLVTSFRNDYYISDYRMGEDGQLYHNYFEDRYDNVVKWMRKAVAEGLLDVECFSNTDTSAKEKMAIGKVAITGVHLRHMTTALRTSLYVDHPEMEYKLLGPMINQAGNIITQVERYGASGFGCHFISAKTEYADKIIEMIEWFNSDEGRLLVYYGVEGETFEYNADGIPVWLPEVKDKREEDGAWYKDTFGYGYVSITGMNDALKRWPKPEDQKDVWEKMYDQMETVIPKVQIDKKSVTYLQNSYPKLDEYREAASMIDWSAEFQRTFFASTEEEALQMLADLRQRYVDIGILDLTAHVQAEWDKLESKDEYSF